MAAPAHSRRRLLGTLASAGALMALPASASAGPVASRPAPAPRPDGTSRRKNAPRPLLIGAYTSAAGGSKGIGVASYDPATGRITAGGTVTGPADPSYLAPHPDGRSYYAVNEQDQGGVTAIRFVPDGAHEVIGRRDSGGAGPCHLSVHPEGRWLLSAHYGSGSVAVHPIDASGALGERTDLVTHSEPPPGPGQQGPHAHQFSTAPDGRHLLAVDLGTDTVYTYRLDTGAGTLSRVAQVSLAPGAGPRGLTFHPSGRYAYLANELDNTAVVCAYDPDSGRLTPGTPQETGTGSGTSYPAQFAVTPDGAFAYLANRGHNSLTRYAVEGDGARLRLLDTVPVGGDFPRHIALSPDGGLIFAANQKSGTVTVFAVDPSDGRLSATGEAFTAPMAACVLPL
ncbi:lactonase family protein [Streptomyces boluensis]|uniref:Beta-propeller fold lactonase family protein n=1 Tax=Streptomyces boluensis TaxID=1775135 RepID=A0A964UKW5_9ACTN|nr:lactonase family protein [Streptomyces boluensis]NBE50989.1 beta-propeller fold lactonase family protein [Streptomyces boluensis]